LHTMVIFPASRSQIREVSENKKERLEKIILEAVEQSYGWVIPTLTYKKDISSSIDNEKVFLLHQYWKENISDVVRVDNENNKKIFFIGPEWGRSSEDEKIFVSHHAQYISLWKNILRTETAAIVMAWELVK